ncbi:hypothetical protein LZ30DRAFT_714555 [Colletotrichum cereale]|nr:hypothetical protein LZ30DRAFT_714555 [Colletotrichum cereale]
MTMHDSDTRSFPAKHNTGGHPPHHGLSIVGSSFNDTQYNNAFISTGQEEIHGIEAFSLQDSVKLDTQKSSIWSAGSFDMTLSPAMLSQLDEQAFDELDEDSLTKLSLVWPCLGGVGQGLVTWRIMSAGGHLHHVGVCSPILRRVWVDRINQRKASGVRVILGWVKQAAGLQQYFDRLSSGQGWVANNDVVGGKVRGIRDHVAFLAPAVGRLCGCCKSSPPG